MSDQTIVKELSCEGIVPPLQVAKDGRVVPVFSEKFMRGARRAARLFECDVERILSVARDMLDTMPFHDVDDLEHALINEYCDFCVDSRDLGVDIGIMFLVPTIMYISPKDVVNWKDYYAFRLLESTIGESNG